MLNNPLDIHSERVGHGNNQFHLFLLKVSFTFFSAIESSLHCFVKVEGLVVSLS